VLAFLAAVPAAVGLAVVVERDGADARNKGGGKKHGHGKGKGKHKKKHKKKQRRRQRSGGDTGSAGYAPDAEERAFLDLINDYRRGNGAGPLALENRLGAAARNHSQDMAAKDYFSHKLSNGDSPEQNIERFGYTDYAVVGENIAAGVATAREVMNLWEDSAEHAHNMRDPEFSEIGIGRAHGGNSKYGWYWTTTFGGH
jgi:uncharacterized protein YkwD